MENKILFIRDHDSAKIPTKGSKNAAGYDLYSISNTIVYPHSRSIIHTGLKLQIPNGVYGKISPRSGLARDYGIHVGAGIIDEDYRGPLTVLLFNLSNARFNVNEGDRIAQIIFEKHFNCEFVEVDELEETERGENGFGSTGRK